MSRLSFSHVLLASFLLIVAILGSAALGGLAALESFAVRSHADARDAVALTAALQQIRERTIDMERSARQYMVLGDAVLLTRFNEAREAASEAVNSLGDTGLDELIDEWRVTVAEASDALTQTHGAEQALEALARATRLNELLTRESRAFGGRTVLDLDRLDIAAGRITVLLGRSGCGKSTLLNLIAGLDTPDAGEILVDGAPAYGQPDHTALIFQHNNLFPWMSAAQNIAFALENQGRAPAEARTEAERLLGEVGLAAFADYRPAKLSGGMRQRVALARAMALAPRLLILDEPFSALDMQTRRMMQRYVLDVWQRTGCTVLMVTHDLHEALMLADRIVLMSSTPVGHVADVLDIDLPRPRDADSDAFRRLQKQLDAFLEHEAVRAEGMSGDFDSLLNAAA